MNYKTINTIILNGKDRNDLKKDRSFYEYLLNNNVAFYYATKISKKPNKIEKQIIEKGNYFNEKFNKTIKFIKEITDERKIDFLLFKTYKYIPEGVDGDIDLFVKEKDFHSFLDLLSQKGFDCIENEPLKAICIKDGYCPLEPRVNSAFHGLNILDENQIWEKIDKVKINNLVIYKATKEIDLLHLLLNILYGPNYLKLYLYKIVKEEDFQKIRTLTLNFAIQKDVDLLGSEFFRKDLLNKKFPLFLCNSDYIMWWFHRIVSSNLSLKNKIKHLVFFIYLKYQYVIFNKLVFAHDWRVKHV